MSGDDIGDEDVQFDIGPAAVEILHDLGYRAQLGEVADLVCVHSSAGGFSFMISYLPLETIDDETYSFSASSFGVVLSLEQINAWNGSGAIGRAYIRDDGAMVLAVNLRNEGLTKAGFTAHLMTYISEVERFGAMARSAARQGHAAS